MKSLKKLGLLVLALGMACAFMSCKSDSDDDDNNVLVEGTETISAGSMWYTAVNVSGAINAKVYVEVKDGDGVKVYTIDADEFDALKNNKSFNYYKDFSSASKVTKFEASGAVPAGSYYFVIVNPNMLLPQTVYKKISK